jgi:hypothetical protein
MSFGWSISASSTDAYDNHIAFPGGGVFTYYLWLLCAPEGSGGMAAAEFGLASPGGGGIILGFTPLNGFFNAGSATNLLLTVGGCPSGPVVAGEILVLVNAPGSLCLTQSTGGVLGAQDCVSPPAAPDSWRGLEFGGGFCFEGRVCDYLDAPIPCCFPDGTCAEFPAPDWEEHCDGSGGYAPPVQFCEDWDCEFVAAGADPRTLAPWGKIKARYYGE